MSKLEQLVTGKRKVTSWDVAKEAGVSRSTVSVVMNDNKNVSISPETHARVLQAAAKLDYRPNISGRSINKRHAYCIGLFSCWDANSPLFARPVQGIIDAARQSQYGVILCDLTSSAETGIETATNYYREGRIDGVIGLMKTTGEKGFPERLLDKLRSVGLPLVLLNANVAGLNVDEVTSDNYQAGYLATQHLISLGHSRIAYLLHRIEGKNFTESEGSRLRGFVDALTEAGIGLREEYVCQINSAAINVDSGYLAFRELLRASSEPPTAVYAISDYLAVGAIYAAQEAGLSVPGDLAIVGTDNMDIARQIRPALTSVEQPLREMGREAVRILLSRLNGDSIPAIKQHIGCQLVVRASCGAIAKG